MNIYRLAWFSLQPPDQNKNCERPCSWYATCRMHETTGDRQTSKWSLMLAHCSSAIFITPSPGEKMDEAESVRTHKTQLTNTMHLSFIIGRNHFPNAQRFYCVLTWLHRRLFLTVSSSWAEIKNQTTTSRISLDCLNWSGSLHQASSSHQASKIKIWSLISKQASSPAGSNALFWFFKVALKLSAGTGLPALLFAADALGLGDADGFALALLALALAALVLDAGFGLAFGFDEALGLRPVLALAVGVLIAKTLAAVLASNVSSASGSCSEAVESSELIEQLSLSSPSFCSKAVVSVPFFCISWSSWHAAVAALRSAFAFNASSFF